MRLARPVLTVTVLLSLAGCAAIAGPAAQSSTPTATPAPVPTATTPPAGPGSGPGSGVATAPTDQSLTPHPYPGRPVTLTRTAAEQFAVAYERALGFNRRLSNETLALQVTIVRSTVLADAGPGYVVRIEVGVSETVRRDGSRVVDEGYYTAAYLVNETTILRAVAPGRAEPAPDPRNGTVIEVPVSIEVTPSGPTDTGGPGDPDEPDEPDRRLFAIF